MSYCCHDDRVIVICSAESSRKSGVFEPVLMASSKHRSNDSIMEDAWNSNDPPSSFVDEKKSESALIASAKSPGHRPSHSQIPSLSQSQTIEVDGININVRFAHLT